MKKKSNPLRRLIERISEYSDIAEIGEIARRYFAMNAFDGVLTIIGVLMGHYAAGVDDAMIVVTTGLTHLGSHWHLRLIGFIFDRICRAETRDG